MVPFSILIYNKKADLEVIWKVGWGERIKLMNASLAWLTLHNTGLWILPSFKSLFISSTTVISGPFLISLTPKAKLSDHQLFHSLWIRVIQFTRLHCHDLQCETCHTDRQTGESGVCVVSALINVSSGRLLASPCLWRLLIIRGKYLPKSTLCWKKAICQVMVMTMNIWKPLGQSSPCQVKAGFSHAMFFKNTPLSISDKCQAVLTSLNLICASHFSIPFSFGNYSILSKNVLKENIIY